MVARGRSMNAPTVWRFESVYRPEMHLQNFEKLLCSGVILFHIISNGCFASYTSSVAYGASFPSRGSL